MASSIDSPFIQRGVEILGEQRRAELLRTAAYLSSFSHAHQSDRYYRKNITMVPFPFHVAQDNKIWVHLKKPVDTPVDADYKSQTLSVCFSTGEVAIKKTTSAQSRVAETLTTINRAGCLDLVIHQSQPFLADPLQKCTLLFPLQAHLKP